ncbi:hypothetical protein Dxin01_03856 [Deinococcus xinjiangensis]|uniref:N-acetylmuramidase domain-containing protein n=1 Tax=Deinococcus xinjiangensis TaxID=457454 RepID=A0ABP9VFU4_9DEIO
MYQPPKPKSPQPQPQPKAPQPLPPKPEPKAPPLPQQWQSALTGTLGKSNVTMTLHRSEERLTGHYSYQGRQGELALEGHVSEDGLTLNMDEKDAKGIKTGYLTLKVQASGIHGIWYPPDNKAGTCYGVHLTPQAAPPQPKPSGPQSQPENAKPPQPAPPKPAQAANLTGSIGKYGIRMSLSVQEGKLSGKYGYISKGTTPFALTGTMDAKGNATFTAGQETFTGTLSQDLKTFKGTWTANGKTLPCELGNVVRTTQPSGAGVMVTQGTDQEILAVKPIPLTGLRGLQLSAAKVYNARGGYFQQVSQQTGVESAVIAAIMLNESGSAAFSTNFQALVGRNMTIRFENHKFYQFWGKAHQQVFNQHYKFGAYNANGKWQTYLGHQWRPDQSSGWQNFHGNQAKEWQVLDASRQLSDTAALESISMGLGQIMGFNYADLGYPNVQAMFKDLQFGARPQLDAIINFVLKNGMKALQRHDFIAFSKAYNGAADVNKVANYAAGLTQNYNAYLAVLKRFGR